MLLNVNQLFKNDRTILTWLILGVAAVFFVWAGILYSDPKLEPSARDKRTKDMQFCKGFISSKGFEVKNKSNVTITVSSTDFQDPKFRFAAVESVFLACKNLALSNFCMGVSNDCGIDGMKFEMTYKMPKKV